MNKEERSYLPLWELDTTSKTQKERNLELLDLEFEKLLERRISDYIQNNLLFCVFQVDTKEVRLSWESKIVSTLAKSNELKPSKDWLGHHSPKDKIRASGLWQVNELYNDELNEREFAALSQLVE